jgi:holo-[acyl-carrier protein] synthase
MIIGVGTDIIEIERVQEAISRTPSFIVKIFTEKEQALFKQKNEKIETIAGNFAAKEAISKALGTGFRAIRPIDIEVLRDELGKPIVSLLNQPKSNPIKVEGEQKESENLIVHLSISHCKTYAVAFATLEYRKKECR